MFINMTFCTGHLGWNWAITVKVFICVLIGKENDMKLANMSSKRKVRKTVVNTQMIDEL